MKPCCECPLNGQPCCTCGKVKCQTPAREANRHKLELQRREQATPTQDTYAALDRAMLALYDADTEPAQQEEALVDAIEEVVVALSTASPIAGMKRTRETLKRWVREQRAGVREEEPVQ